ncbi:MAG: tyrosine-type recombinase/integrase [Candidatus Enterenecus sp.]
MARRPEFYFDGTYYRKRLRLPDGRYKDIRAKTKEALRAKLYDAETAMRLGLALTDDTTVAELAVQFYTNRAGSLSESRKADYRNAINVHICPVIGVMRVRDVKPEDCQRVKAAVADKSFSLQQKVIGVMRMIFTVAVDNGLIYKSPADKIKPGGAKPAEKEALTPEQCDQLAWALEGTRAYIPVMLGMYAGLRREEIFGLRWEDVDLDAKPPRLTVNNAVRFASGKAVFPAPLKSKKSHRVLAIPDVLAAALREGQAASKSAFVCPGQDGGCITYQGMRNVVDMIYRRCPASEGQIARRARLEAERGKPFAARRPNANMRMVDFRVTLHQLRHTYITRLILAGVPVKKVQYAAGHDDPQITLQIYTHVMDNTPESMADDISRAFPPAGSV